MAWRPPTMNGRKCPACDELGERLDCELLDREVRTPVRQLADREHLRDRRMRDLLQPLRFGEELRPLLPRLRQVTDGAP
jgi:hypothetical protein